MERLVATCEKLNDMRRQLERAIAGIEGPLHIVQECLYHREKRQGEKHVHESRSQVAAFSELCTAGLQACLTMPRYQTRT